MALPNNQTADQDNSDESKSNLGVAPKVLVCWDFDYSLINGNSDYFVHEKLFADKQYTTSMAPVLKKKALDEKGISVFQDFQDVIGWPLLFQRFNLTPSKFEQLLSDIPVFDENIHIVRTLDEYKNNDNQVHQYIVSNANDVLCDVILKTHDLHGNVFHKANVFTNPGWFDHKTGILRCARYHNKENPHSCNMCAANLCKSKVINEEIFSNYDCTDRMSMIYIGDGGNDYCPVSNLGPNDFAFVRQFDKKRGLELKIDENAKKLKCNVMKWRNGKELLANFKKALPFVKF